MELEIKQYSQVTYLGCVLDKTMSAESLTLKTTKKINQKHKFLYGKNWFLTPELRRLLCNAMIQPHFDYACSAWYPNLTQKLKKKLQLWKTNVLAFVFNWKKCLQYLMKNLKIETGSQSWKSNLRTLKKTDNLNTFKHNLKKHFFNQMTWFLLTLPLLLILFIKVVIIILLLKVVKIKSSNIIIIITTVIAIIIILLILLLVLILSSILLLLLFFPSTHYYISTVFVEGPQ